MHILLVTHYFEPDSGAAAVRLSRLARLLHKRGHQVTVLATLPHYPQGHIQPDYRGRLFASEQREGLQVLRAWLWATPSTRISRRLVSQLSFMLTAGLRGPFLPRPEVLLIEGQPVFTALAGWWISRLKGAPYVLNVSDLWPDHLQTVGMKTTHPAYRAARWLVNGLYRGAAHIVAMSGGWAERIAEHTGGQARSSVIYNAVDLQRFRPGLDAADFRARHGLDPSQRLVTFIGTLTTPYDIDTMLAAAARLAERPDVAFMFVGAGTQAAYLRQRLAEDGAPPVRLIDWIDHAQMPQAWSASHITYWALRDEPLYRGTIPARIYEVLACGVPVAAAMAGEAVSVLEVSGGGLAVPPGDVDGLVGAITRLLDDPALHRACSERGRAYAETHYDAEQVAAAYEAVLLAAVEERGR